MSAELPDDTTGARRVVAEPVTTQPGVTTWLEDVNAHVGHEPSLMFPEPIRDDRRWWAWSVNGKYYALDIGKHIQDEYRVRVSAPGRYAEIFTTGEPVEAVIRSALRFVGLLPDVEPRSVAEVRP